MTADAASAPTVVYIGGAGRSGSTLLDNVLGSSPGWFSAGELRLLWSARQLWTHQCGCGQPLRECELWSAVLREVGAVDLSWAAGMERRVLRSRQTWRLLQRQGVGALPGGRDYAALTGRLLRAITAVTGDRVVVDSSKSPIGVAVLATAGARVAAVHLVRDPRAVAWSWQRPNMTVTSARPLKQRGVASAAMEWTTNNFAMEAVMRRSRVRRTRIRYEDLIDRPGHGLSAIAEAVGSDLEVRLSGTTVSLGPNHTVAGNPSRFRIGDVHLRRDDEWRSRLPRHDRRVATALTSPLLLRYGYPLR
ncbi:MAG: hypothetical protein QOC92_351 [Acidimicrobiaceae bacterium]